MVRWAAMQLLRRAAADPAAKQSMVQPGPAHGPRKPGAAVEDTALEGGCGKCGDPFRGNVAFADSGECSGLQAVRASAHARDISCMQSCLCLCCEVGLAHG